MLDEDTPKDLKAQKKKKEKTLQESEDLNFLLKSGIILCKLVNKIVPGTQIDIEKLEVNSSE